MVGRHRPVRIKTVNLQPSRIYFRCQVTDSPDNIFYSQADHNDCEQVGDIIQNTYQDAFYWVPDVISDLVGKFFGLREDREENRDRQYQQDEKQQVAYDACHEDQ